MAAPKLDDAEKLDDAQLDARIDQRQQAFETLENECVAAEQAVKDLQAAHDAIAVRLNGARSNWSGKVWERDRLRQEFDRLLQLRDRRGAEAKTRPAEPAPEVKLTADEAAAALLAVEVTAAQAEPAAAGLAMAQAAQAENEQAASATEAAAARENEPSQQGAEPAAASSETAKAVPESYPAEPRAPTPVAEPAAPVPAQAQIQAPLPPDVEAPANAPAPATELAQDRDPAPAWAAAAAKPEPAEATTQRAAAAEPSAPVRPALRGPLHVELDAGTDNHLFVGFSGNIEEGGIFVATYAPRNIGEELSIALSLQDGGSGQVLDCKVRVAWIMDLETSNTTGMGLRFTGLAEPGRAALQRYAADHEPMFFPD